MITGKVKWFDAQKGYGFITRDDGAEDVFVHCSAVRYGKKLNEGDKVEFEIENSPRGLKAKSVRLLTPLAETNNQK